MRRRQGSAFDMRALRATGKSEGRPSDITWTVAESRSAPCVALPSRSSATTLASSASAAPT